MNPVILEKSEPIELEEGCLSVPDEREKVRRFRKVKVRYQDRTGATHELEAEGRLAHVLQHEIDHLDGTVFVRHLSQLKRSLIRKRMVKVKAYRREHGEECKDPTHHHGGSGHDHGSSRSPVRPPRALGSLKSALPAAAPLARKRCLCRHEQRREHR